MSTMHCAVIGYPVAHSKSPRIHSAFARQLGLDLAYGAIEITPGTFAEQVQKRFQEGYTGLNVTVPYKEEAYVLADELSPRARLAAAVNTLHHTPDGIVGHNTDGIGLVHDLTERQNVELFGKRILVLGAGGAVRGVLGPLLEKQPRELVVTNRTVLKAEQLCDIFAPFGPIHAASMDDLSGTFDVVINGTSASLQGALPNMPATALRPDTVTYDMMYGANDTAFNAWAQTQGVSRTLDGLGMLVSQAAAAFTIWTGLTPDAEPVMTALRRELTAVT